MTVTPSPQSVVVPVAVLNEAAGVLDCEGYGPLSMSLLSCLTAPAPSSLAGGEVVSVPALTIAACKGEQEHFEAWAKSKRYEMSEHPLHYIFNDPKTDAARMGWNAALAYVREAALSPEAPAREGVDLDGLLTTALTDELQGGGAEVPYSIIAERVAARVADEASALSCTLTAAAEEALSFLQNAPLESGICCCGDPISGHGYGSGHSPVDDLAYHSSQVAEKLQAALTPRHEAPASEGERERLRIAYKTGYAEGVEDSNGMFDRESCEEGWGQYAENISAQPALPARLPLPTVDDGRGGRRPINPQDDR